MKNELEVFVPSNITGFFEIINNPNPLKKGSKGAGITLDEGVITKTSIKDGDGKINVTVNNKVEDLNTVSKITIDMLKNNFSLDLSDYDVNINHETILPISAGFGTSAGFSLGICYTLPQLLNKAVSLKQCGDIAHLTEVSTSNGLGDVISEINGGCVLRLKEGSPSNGVIDKIINTKPIYVITKTLSSIDTSEIIDNPTHIKRINESSSILLNELLKNPTLENFIKLSRKFSEKSKLINDELHEILDIMDEESIGSSMAMLGNTAFCLSNTPDISIENCMITKINSSGLKYNNKKS